MQVKLLYGRFRCPSVLDQDFFKQAPRRMFARRAAPDAQQDLRVAFSSREGAQFGSQLRDLDRLVQERRVKVMCGDDEQYSLQRLSGVQPGQRIIAYRAEASEQR